MKATPIDDLRKPHPEQKQIDADAVRLLLATSPAGYANKTRKPDIKALFSADVTPLPRP
ncbi:MAG TPA: hypothetical protein VJK02_01725 [Anaerolineales bacterium]|nr:hypothetical protein [Anaerolineales bacterium]